LAASQGLTSREIVSAWSSLIFNLAELRPLELKFFPYNDKGELDFHRPFIDEVQFFSQKGEKMKRKIRVRQHPRRTKKGRTTVKKHSRDIKKIRRTRKQLMRKYKHKPYKYLRKKFK